MDEHRPQSSDNLESWLLVSQCSGIGSRYFQRLMEHFGDPEKILSASQASLVELGIPQNTVRNLKNRTSAEIQPTLNWLTTPEHQLITLTDSRYPALLKEIDGPPPLLYLIGNTSLHSQPQIAIVGSPQAPDTRALLDACSAEYRPHQIVAVGEPEEGEPTVPLLRDRGQIEGRATAYVCVDFACQRPVVEPDELRTLLG